MSDLSVYPTLICGKCSAEMEAIKNPVSGITPWPLSCWYCADCGYTVDPVTGEGVSIIPGSELIQAGEPAALVKEDERPFCGFCADGEGQQMNLMSPIYGRKGFDGDWLLTHWYCDECLRLDEVKKVAA